MDLPHRTTTPSCPRKKQRCGSTLIKIPTANDNHNQYDDNDSSDERFSQRGEEEDYTDGMSTDGNAGEEDRADAAGVETKRNNRGRNDSRNSEQETREYNRRERTKQLLADSQQCKQIMREDNVIDLEVNSADDDVPRSFDGVRVDKVVNEKNRQHVDNLKQRLGGREDEIDVVRKNNFRGSKHDKIPAMATSSSKLTSPSRGNGKRIQGRKTRLHNNNNNNNNGTDSFASSHGGMDPLDYAQNLQEGNRWPSTSYDPAVNNGNYTKTMAGYMDKIPQLGKGSMDTKRSMLAHAATKRQELSHPLVEGNGAANRRRQSTANAALSARRGRSDRSRKSPPPSYGGDDHHSFAADETRNGQKSGLQWRGNKERPNKKSSGGVIAEEECDRYETTGRTSDWGSEPRVHDADLAMAIAACEQPLNTNDMSSFGIQRAPPNIRNKQINDINGYLRNTKKGKNDYNDDVESIHGSQSINSDRQRRANARADLGVKDTNGRKKSDLRTQIKKYGMRLETHTDDKGWIDSSKSNNAQVQQKKSRLRKGTRQSTSPSPPITNHFTTSSRKTRSSSRAKSADGDVITIESSEDEGDDTSNDASEVAAERGVRPRRAVGDVASIDAVRIAIGKKVVKSKCTLSFQFGTADPYLQISFEFKGKMSEHRVYLKNEELLEVKYYIADDTAQGNEIVDSMTVIAFRITPTKNNNLNKYSSCYDQGECDDTDTIPLKRYVSVEFRDADDFRAMLEQMRQHPDLGVWCEEDSEMEFRDRKKYLHALIVDSQKEKIARCTAIKTRSGGANKNNDAENKLLLVYPFDVDEELLREASCGLLELGGELLGVQEDEPSVEDKLVEDDVTRVTKKPPRTHHVTIRDEDYERLSPGQFLNDTLVDFWMRWISRGESQLPSSDVHFFTSHFMTTLKGKGPEAVVSWTEKKGINIFEKKLIFIPVNADLHWSLLVVVNPGLIANYYNDDLPETEDHSFILFLDSLKMHNKHVYAKHIRQWLNSEHRRLGRGEVGGRIDPFTHDCIRVVSPKIPHQENGCDCGVFVCRYAYNLYIMRHHRFTLKGYKANFASLITNSPAFQFDMSEIARIREEMTTLVDNLSKVYLPWLKEQELADRKAKRGARLKDSSEVVSGDANEVSTDINNEENSPVATLVKEANEDNVILNDDAADEGKDEGCGDGVDSQGMPSAEKENVLNKSSGSRGCAPGKVLTTLNEYEDSPSPLEDEDGNGSESLLDDIAPLGNSVMEMDIDQERRDSPMESQTISQTI